MRRRDSTIRRPKKSLHLSSKPPTTLARDCSRHNKADFVRQIDACPWFHADGKHRPHYGGSATCFKMGHRPSRLSKRSCSKYLGPKVTPEGSSAAAHVMTKDHGRTRLSLGVPQIRFHRRSRARCVARLTRTRCVEGPVTGLRGGTPTATPPRKPRSCRVCDASRESSRRRPPFVRRPPLSYIDSSGLEAGRPVGSSQRPAQLRPRERGGSGC
ncbi:hypothetical protein C2E23DRAFT_28498 [Lenzites betulinus]|nr:hypothetical protein C2E23DRAFT_28498 [Lenzites betulinus]